MGISNGKRSGIRDWLKKKSQDKDLDYPAHTFPTPNLKKMQICYGRFTGGSRLR
jgi:hypothetical protein